MPIRDIVKKISATHGYRVTGNYWSRIGAMSKKYGEDVVIEAVESATPKEIPLTRLLNIVEKKSQFILENGKGSIDELINNILNESGSE